MVDVQVLNDSIVEGTEKFNLSFNISSSLSDLVTPGNITSAVGSISDNTSKDTCVCIYTPFILLLILTVAMVHFSKSTYMVGEDSGLVSITLIISNPSSFSNIVQVLDNNVSATGE